MTTTPGRRSPFEIVLVHPEIPQNTGSIARTCAATGTRLRLVEPLGFSLADRYLKRAGLDYWPHVDLVVHPSWQDVLETSPTSRRLYFSARAELSYIEADYRSGDQFIFGCETKGLPKETLATHAPGTCFTIPIFNNNVRSLNLSNAVSIVLYEGLRQAGLLAA